MIELIENQHIGGLPGSAGTVGLSRKGGIPRLFLKSPLLENYFKTASGGEVSPRPDKVFGRKLYRIQLDPNTEQEFLKEHGVCLSGADAFFGINGSNNTPWFNLAFLRTVGASEGVYFPLQSMLPIKLIESGAFAKCIRGGIGKLLKEFIVDFNTELSFSYTTRVE